MAHTTQQNDLKEAKTALDVVIKKSRIHLYKPIQIAEILYRDRVFGDIDLARLETYRNKSKAWRDEMCIALLGRVSTSSAKFQDDLFNAIPPHLIAKLGKYNKSHNGVVEAYIYSKFTHKYAQLNNALSLCLNATKNNFNITDFINAFWAEAGLKRSIDKIYEIIAYALFDTLLEALNLNISISLDKNQIGILDEFNEFVESILCVKKSTLESNDFILIQKAKIYRVGVTNAADRGLDMYGNWGLAIQVKHLTLDMEIAQNIISSVNSDRIIIVCKDAQKDIILSILNQVGFNRIAGIVTENILIAWYEKALRGKYSNILGNNLLKTLHKEIVLEFPSLKELPTILSERKYPQVDDF